MRKEGKKKSLEIWQEQFFLNNKIRTTPPIFYSHLLTPKRSVTQNTEPAVWLIFNCFSRSEYFFLVVMVVVFLLWNSSADTMQVGSPKKTLLEARDGV